MAKKLTSVEKLIKAEEAFLIANGWKKVSIKGSANFWSPLHKIGYVYPDDRVFRDSAIKTTKAALDFPIR